MTITACARVHKVESECRCSLIMQIRRESTEPISSRPPWRAALFGVREAEKGADSRASGDTTTHWNTFQQTTWKSYRIFTQIHFLKGESELSTALKKNTKYSFNCPIKIKGHFFKASSSKESILELLRIVILQGQLGSSTLYLVAFKKFKNPLFLLVVTFFLHLGFKIW